MEFTAETFAAMGPEERPFGPDAMTVGEIEVYYRDAKAPRKSIPILADLCGTTEANIRKLLEARGKILGPKQRAALIEQRLAEGVKVKDIIKELCIGRNTFYKFCSSRGIRLPGQDPEKRIELIRQYSEEGMSGPEIAGMLQMKPQSLYNFCRDNGIRLTEMRLPVKEAEEKKEEKNMTTDGGAYRTAIYTIRDLLDQAGTKDTEGADYEFRMQVQGVVTLLLQLTKEADA